MLEVQVCHFVTWLRLSKNGFVWLRLTPLRPLRIALRVPKRHGVVSALPSRLGLLKMASFGDPGGVWELVSCEKALRVFGVMEIWSTHWLISTSSRNLALMRF
jgi:hypothetical protein